MATGLRESQNASGFYLQMHNASSGDLLWGGLKTGKTRKRKASPDLFPVERIISKRTVRNATEYLVKWKGYSGFDNSWEDEENLTADLLRSYNQPDVQPERLIKNLDCLRVAFTTKLKARSNNKLTLDFEHDCFRYLFNGKGRKSKDDKHILLEKDDFRKCGFMGNWDVVLDRIGDGVMVKYPVKVRVFLTKSPKSFNMISGTLQESRQMIIEKLSIDFVHQPVTVPTVE